MAGCTPATPSSSPDLAMTDAGVDGAGGIVCQYQALPATAGAGMPVAEGAVQAGAYEAFLDLPVGSALGGYTSRQAILGNKGYVDNRKWEYSGTFAASVGIETAPRVKALALTAGDESIVILKADLIFSMDSVTHDVTDRMGAKYAGKIVFAGSHSHSMPGQFSTNSGLGVGVSRFRKLSYDRLVDGLVAAAQAAVAAQKPAKIGIALDDDFDPMNHVSQDRRPENDLLSGGPRKDSHLFVMRVDGSDGTPIAVVDVVGVHGTVMNDDNPLMSVDAPGSIERGVEEQFASKVVAIHLQGAAGDVSPAGEGGVTAPTNDFNYNFARVESIGRIARAEIMAAYAVAGGAMKDTLAMEMVTRSVPLGPDASTFNIRGGALSYAPFVAGRSCDRNIFDGSNAVISPIDEFNAPYGAALCGSPNDSFVEDGQMPNVDGLPAYQSCELVDATIGFLGRVVNLPFEAPPVCASTRTTVSAIRLGDYLIATLPGEPLTLLADKVRSLSPVAPEKTIVVGYAQGHVGYLLIPEDWLQAGYEPSINFWGPLEGEYIAERAGDMMKLAMSDTRQDAAKDGIGRLLLPNYSDESAPADPVPPPDPAPMAGTIPSAVPSGLYVRTRALPSSAQPAATVPRLTGSARFIWIGEDPMSGTPRPTLQRETAAGSGVFTDVLRKSGRPVQDGDLLLTWTPDPLARPKKSTAARTHYWALEWQAVAWSGATAADAGDDLGARAGVPLGNYRFHVDGTGYTLDSQPFAVVAGPLSVSAATTTAGTTLQLTAGYLAPDGWRLLTLDGSSNEAVAVSQGPINVKLNFMGGTSMTVSGVALTSPGQATVAVPAGQTVQSVEVTDAFGNFGMGTL